MMISKNKTNKFTILVTTVMFLSTNINAMQQLAPKNDNQQHIAQITDKLNSAEHESYFSFFDAPLPEIAPDIFERDPAEIAKTLYRPSRPITSILGNSPHIETLPAQINLDFEQPTEEAHKIMMHSRTNSEFAGINFGQLDQ